MSFVDGFIKSPTFHRVLPPPLLTLVSVPITIQVHGPLDFTSLLRPKDERRGRPSYETILFEKGSEPKGPITRPKEEHPSLDRELVFHPLPF